MRRGTTPTHTFTLPFDTALVSKVKVSYKQDGTVVLRKYTADCNIEGDKVSVKLTREESLLFNDRDNIKVQIEAELTEGDTTLVSDVFVLRVNELLCEEALK